MALRRYYQVVYPMVPGASMAIQADSLSLCEARSLARERTSDRRDLTYQDVRIERCRTTASLGALVEYAGPCR